MVERCSNKVGARRTWSTWPGECEADESHIIAPTARHHGNARSNMIVFVENLSVAMAHWPQSYKSTRAQSTFSIPVAVQDNSTENRSATANHPQSLSSNTGSSSEEHKMADGTTTVKKAAIHVSFERSANDEPVKSRTCSLSKPGVELERENPCASFTVRRRQSTD